MRIPTLEEVQRAVQDDYVVEAPLGQGGMGAVYRARHRSLGSAVAIKVLPVPASVGADELERFRREAMITARLQHPNIVPVHEFDIRDDLAFLVMPLIEGEGLDRRLADRGPMPWDEARALLGQVGAALEFAHERGVVHRDIKPANILWEPATGRWLITDFGIARRAQEDGAPLTLSGVTVGTPAYMAPEQASGRDVDRRADVYGLGAVAFEALTGTRPESMTDASRASRDLRAARPDLSPRRVAAVASALALDRTERPPTVREWLARLEAADSRRGTRTALGLVTLVGIVLAVLVWQRQSAPAPATQPPLTAVLPLSVSPAPGLDSSLGRSLATAIAEQLRWLPEQRVATVSAVDRALREEFGGTEPDPDTAARFVAARFGAARLLTGRVRAAGDRVEVAVRLVDSAGGPLRADSASAPADSLGALVQDLVVSVFAQGLARRQVGWSPVLPRGGDAVRHYLAARPLLRAGAYREAIERYEAVIAADSAFAPAYFERTLAEVLRAQPTRVNRAVRTALGATRRYREGLDPATRDLLAAYETLVAEGDPARAHEQLSDLVRRHENAPDAWFILGYLEFHLGPLFGVEPASARYAFERAAALAPEFAAPRAFLGWIALAAGDPAGRDHLRAYLAIDSTSVSAELVQLVDSIRFGGARAAIQAAASLEERPTPALELIALAGASLTLGESERTLAGDGIRALRARATTGLDRAIAFRLEMAWLLGGARLESAARLLGEGRRQNVPSDELDAWTVLLGVTGLLRQGPPPGEVDGAARRLAPALGDPTAQWLVARWWQGRDPTAAAPARRALAAVAAGDDGPALLAASLRDDLDALDRLSAGDTAGALERWERATRRYQIEEVPFGLVASLWPLEVERARVEAARGDHDAVALVAGRFRYAVGFMDQVARLDVLPRGIAALQARHDPLRARQLADRLRDLWAGADGPGVALRDSVRALVPGT